MVFAIFVNPHENVEKISKPEGCEKIKADSAHLIVMVRPAFQIKKKGHPLCFLSLNINVCKPNSLSVLPVLFTRRSTPLAHITLGEG